MSRTESETRPKLVEFQPGLFVFENLQRRPSERASIIFNEIIREAKRLSEQRIQRESTVLQALQDGFQK